MVIIEALNAMYGDCLLLRYGPKKSQKIWVIDGGPKGTPLADGTQFSVWKDVLLRRLEKLGKAPLTVHLGMVSHIDDDHINGLQRLTDLLVRNEPGKTKPVQFERFWFNSFLDIVGPARPAAMPAAAPMAAAEAAISIDAGKPVPIELHDYLHTSQAVVQSVGQGNKLAQDLGSLGLLGNTPVFGLVASRKGQDAIPIEGAMVTIVGPRADRLEDLRRAWAAAMAQPSTAAMKAALQELFLPTSKLDRSVPNLSSIVVLVEVEGKRLLLTGDALGDDIVGSWIELGLGSAPVQLDVLKMPHHGSIRNCSALFLTHFEATNYIFSADGHYENPDGPTVEGLVRLQGSRDITLHFTNQKIGWKVPYTTDKSKKTVPNLDALVTQLRTDYPGPWKVNFRKPTELGVTIAL